MDKSRQQFEEWLVRNHSDTCNNINFEIDSKGDYRYFGTRLAWEAWQASRESLEKERDQAIRHLILVFQQYANNDHLFMSAGENACEFLEDLGYGIDTGRNLELTDKGKQLIKEDWE
ncbi:TPA: hypothetical protein ACKRKK_000433 [Proteus mirabilis]|uniref:hypothetical protein n=1 Tax=Proteus mirabilis TaxID=584 RepID=UPI001448E1DE|nr:hypothetical protein [Proteus mirabilis]MDF7191518.1 hypothetical protein [Proteus mirabilis]MDF7241984.1 hypothetical protein [Proteus mirabilis]MDF7357583.1 hypothetical protein [Proteus mirabilis]MDF7386853.1 hypothetical protein [Proteus mirabilis]MDF7462089.1 hypothetical protein [Proteus mirabilis]